jgi:hypothetical protein
VGGYESRELSLLVYEPLVRGTGIIDDSLGTRTDSLRVEHTANGGYWSKSFTIRGRQEEVEAWVDDGLGRHVELYDTGLAPVWEGFVNQVNANIGSLSLNRGPLMQVANRIKVVYTPVDTSTNPPTSGARDETDYTNDTDSQDLYGIIERIISVSSGDVTAAEQARDTALEDSKYPNADETENLESSVVPSATIECLGYYHWLGAYTVDLSTTDLQDADAKVQAVLSSDPNNLFSTDTTYINSNTTQVGAQDQEYRTALSVIAGIVALGDASFNRWVFGFGPNQRPFYNTIATDTMYQRRLSDPEQRLEIFGTSNQVLPWDARAGEWVFYTDLLVGRTRDATNFRADPRYLFTEQTTFTAPWGLTLRGAKVTRLAQLLKRQGLGGSHA